MLIGANDRAAYSVARQFSINGATVVLCNWENHSIRQSKFITEFVQLSNVERNFNLFMNELVELVTSKKFSFILPINDTAIIIAQELSKRISGLNIINLNPPEVLKYASNKHDLLLKCNELSISTPTSCYISDLKDLHEFLETKLQTKVHFPLIIKPVSSKLLFNNEIYSFTVKKVNNKIELIDAIREIIQVIPVMVQEVIEGHGVGFNVLAKDGDLLNFYMHERIHENWGGGESSYRKTIVGDPYQLIDKTKNLIKEIGWSGVCMVEYKVNESNSYIMEINGRYWGSIELGIFAGMNFPLSQLTNHREKKEESSLTIHKEFFARNLSHDFRWAIIGLLKHRNALFFLKWLLSLTCVFRKNEIVEDSLFRDFRFRISLFKRRCLQIAKKINKTIYVKTLSKAHKAIWQPQIGDNIAFVCKGNICRSSFAEFYAKSKFKNFNFFSMGTIEQGMRLAPTNSIEAAKLFNIDLELHLSKGITSIDTMSIDKFIVMDKENYYQLIKIDRIPTEKVIFLSNFSEINDPYGSQIEEFIATYNSIVNCINILFESK